MHASIRISRYSLAAATFRYLAAMTSGHRRYSLRLRDASYPVNDGRTSDDMGIFALREYARTWDLRNRRIEGD